MDINSYEIVCKSNAFHKNIISLVDWESNGRSGAEAVLHCLNPVCAPVLPSLRFGPKADFPAVLSLFVYITTYDVKCDQ